VTEHDDVDDDGKGQGRLARLIAVLRILLAERRISKADVKRIVGVESESSFKRIRRELKRLGFPLTYDREDGSYHVPPSATFERFRLDPRLRGQIAQLRASASALGPLMADALADVLAPYEAVIALDDPDARAVVSLRAPQPRVDAKFFRDVDRALSAVREHRWLSFVYRKSASDAPSRRTIAPYALHLHDGRYYVWGVPEGETVPKLFALDLTSELALEDDTFEADPGLSLDDELRASFGVMIGSDPPRRVVVRFSAEAAPFVRCRRWPAEVAMHDRGEDLIVEFDVSKLDELVAWVLSFGGTATIESPEDARALLAARARAVLATHER
jgi:predicted DNA-binding transcriptional regulator YafY